MNNRYPRLLFLTPCAFNAVTGTGVTFTNLFRGWPPERLATLTDDPVPVSHNVCTNYYHLTARELHYRWPASWLCRQTSRQAARAAQQQEVAAPTRSSAFAIARSLARRVLGTAGVPDRGRLSPSLRAWVEAFRPELIFTILGTPGYFDLVDVLSREWAIPFVLHVMDHGTIDPLRTGLFRHYLRWTCRRRLQALVPRAARCLAIGEIMAEEYTRTFGRPFAHFQNTIDLERWQPCGSPDGTCQTPARVLYVGSLLPYAVLHSLQECCQAVQELNRAGQAIRLTICTPRRLFAQEIQQLPSDVAVVVEDVPETDAAFFARLHQADLLLLPVNFDSASVHYIRLSMPTKVPAYLASGVPILVYGPPGVAQVEYARKHGWGHVVDRQDRQQLKEGLRTVLDNRALRRELSHRARQTAQRFHDAVLVRQAFQQVLIEAAQERAQPLSARHRAA